MKAFEVLDQENKGYLTTEELTKYMSEEGIIYSNYFKITIIAFTMVLIGEGSWGPVPSGTLCHPPPPLYIYG